MERKPLLDIPLLNILISAAGGSRDDCEAVTNACLFAFVQLTTQRLVFDNKSISVDAVAGHLRDMLNRQIDLSMEAIRATCDARQGVTFSHDAAGN